MGRGCQEGTSQTLILNKPLIRSHDLLTRELPPIQWDVHPLISRGDRVVVFGEFGSFKSWILLHLGWHLAVAKTWLDTFTIPDPRKVLYVDEEMNERTLRRRGKRLAMGANITGDPGMAFLSRAGVRFDAYGASTLLAYLNTQKFTPQVVIVEAMRRVLIGDENEAKDLAAFWRNLEPISRLGITFIISHHMSKPPMEGKRNLRYRASGSTDILAGSDASFAVERLSEGMARITGIKARDDVELKPFTVKLDDNGDRQGPVTLTPVLTGTPAGPARRLSPGEVKDVFALPAPGTRQS